MNEGDAQRCALEEKEGRVWLESVKETQESRNALVAQNILQLLYQTPNTGGATTTALNKKVMMWCIKETFFAATVLILALHVCFYGSLFPFYCPLPAK